jgi:homoserine dehydrogenase
MMAKVRVAINGFGRIGRQVLKALLERHLGVVDLVAINDLADPQTNAHLFRYDTNYGKFEGTVEVKEDALVINGDEIKVLSEKDPAKLPWKDLGVDIVLESTGVFTDANKAGLTLKRERRKSSSVRRRLTRTSLSFWASTTQPTTLKSITSSPTHLARPTAWLRYARCFTKNSELSMG